MLSTYFTVLSVAGPSKASGPMWLYSALCFGWDWVMPLHQVESSEECLAAWRTESSAVPRCTTGPGRQDRWPTLVALTFQHSAWLLWSPAATVGICGSACHFLQVPGILWWLGPSTAMGHLPNRVSFMSGPVPRQGSKVDIRQGDHQHLDSSKEGSSADNNLLWC